MPGKGAWSVGIGGGEGGGDARRAAAGAVELAAHAVTAALRKAFLTSLTHTREPVAGEESVDDAARVARALAHYLPQRSVLAPLVSLPRLTAPLAGGVPEGGGESGRDEGEQHDGGAPGGWFG